MKASTGFRSAGGWDVAMVATIVALVLLGWLTAAGGNNARVPHPAHSAAHACPSAAVTPGTWARVPGRPSGEPSGVVVR
jgi:hypothetical protein